MYSGNEKAAQAVHNQAGSQSETVAGKRESGGMAERVASIIKCLRFAQALKSRPGFPEGIVRPAQKLPQRLTKLAARILSNFVSISRSFVPSRREQSRGSGEGSLMVDRHMKFRFLLLYHRCPRISSC